MGEVFIQVNNIFHIINSVRVLATAVISSDEGTTMFTVSHLNQLSLARNVVQYDSVLYPRKVNSALKLHPEIPPASAAPWYAEMRNIYIYNEDVISIRKL